MDDFHKILDKLRSVYSLDSNIEFTIEANPDDIQPNQVNAWKKAGVNRLSIGIQSFQPAALQWMNRAHTTEQAHEAIRAAQGEGIGNISIDLIYGTPHLTNDDLKADLAMIDQYQIQHLSCYALTVEEKTALHAMIQNKKIDRVHPEQQAAHFEIITKYTEKIGMEHYEISNFSQPGFRSKHNSNYWKGVPYLGLGPSAHSYNKNTRQWNVANNQLYFSTLEKNELPFEIEQLPLATKYNEYMMISLRCMEGFSLEYIFQNFGPEFQAHTLKIMQGFVAKNWLTETSQGFALTKSAKFFADGIASDFFWIN
jgi:oxygen-independent coproporphyrinogen-3 oxidase